MVKLVGMKVILLTLPAQDFSEPLQCGFHLRYAKTLTRPNGVPSGLRRTGLGDGMGTPLCIRGVME